MRDSAEGSNLSEAAGVIPRAINQIFDHIGKMGGDLNTVKCSFLELYNEEATDLLVLPPKREDGGEPSPVSNSPQLSRSSEQQQLDSGS